MLKVSIWTMGILCSIGCVTTLDPQAQAVRVVTDKEKETACQFLGIVTAAHSMGFTYGQNVESVMNKLRNETVRLGGNAMKLIQANSTGSVWSGSISTGSAEALRCDLAKLDAMRQTSQQGETSPKKPN